MIYSSPVMVLLSAGRIAIPLGPGLCARKLRQPRAPLGFFEDVHWAVVFHEGTVEG
jgi:hypothetical protein